MLQTELTRVQQRLEEQEVRREQAQRLNEQLAEANRQLSRRMAEVMALQSQLREQATQDALTGLANRRHLNETLPSVLALALRERAPLAVVLIDLDHFKQINDRHGHPVGDQVLSAFGALLRAHLRKSDLAFRYGGEEFCLLLPRTPVADAQRKVQALLAEWCEQTLSPAEGAPLNGLSFSAGATDSTLAPPSPGPLLNAADQLLLLAKRGGRRRVVIPGG
jgi:diguanylate cyclase (GGDEF)-like protein